MNGNKSMEPTHLPAPSDFIRDIIEDDLKTNKYQGRVATRFPPEPNGYPHIGHAKSVCLNFGIAAQYGGTCNLRMDDTDPSGEDQEYVNSIIWDVKWLGFDWEDRLYYASDYYEQLYQYALQLMIACQESSVRRLESMAGPDSALWFVPYVHNGRSCYKVLWGFFPGSKEALAARSAVPAPILKEVSAPPVVPVQKILNP